jgi:hypothetical protein
MSRLRRIALTVPVAALGLLATASTALAGRFVGHRLTAFALRQHQS